MLGTSHKSELVNIFVKGKDGYTYVVILALIVGHLHGTGGPNDLQTETVQNHLNNQWENDQFYDLFNLLSKY